MQISTYSIFISFTLSAKQSGAYTVMLPYYEPCQYRHLCYIHHNLGDHSVPLEFCSVNIGTFSLDYRHLVREQIRQMSASFFVHYGHRITERSQRQNKESSSEKAQPGLHYCGFSTVENVLSVCGDAHLLFQLNKAILLWACWLATLCDFELGSLLCTTAWLYNKQNQNCSNSSSALTITFTVESGTIYREVNTFDVPEHAYFASTDGSEIKQFSGT